MQYMGGKARIAGKLAEVMLAATPNRLHYLEPFMGAAWVLDKMAPHFRYPAAGDVMPDVALLWQAVQQGWMPPTELSREEWYRLKDSEPSALRAFAGFGCSFGGRFFEGYAKNGRGDDFAGAAARGIIKKRVVAERTLIDHTDYRSWHPGPGTVVYCDPPYAGTKWYSGAPAWDAEPFWDTARRWSADGATVFVSEYTAPVDARCVWSADVRTSLKVDNNRGTVTEKLFTL